MNEANRLEDVIGQPETAPRVGLSLGDDFPETIDQAHERLGHTAPRVSPADMEANVRDVRFFNAAEAIHGEDMILGRPSQVLPESLRLLTVCVIVLRNGFVLVGHSAPASPENFNAELGQRFARENAMKQLWPLMGYALREKLAQVDAR